MNVFLKGLKAGIPIGLGYFAVAFSLGIVASSANLTVIQGFISSLLINASAGESAGFLAISNQVSYLEMILIMFVANARYILMSFAMSQKIAPNTNIIHRILLAFFLTDEYFALAISQDGYLDPRYSYGAISFAAPMWALGTALGIVFGNILPSAIVSALSVALYAMFLAIIIPSSKTNKVISKLIICSFVSSYIFINYLHISSSLTIIILTIVIASYAANRYPIKEISDHE